MGKRLKRAKENVDLLSPKKDTMDESLDDLECHVHMLENKVASLEEKNASLTKRVHNTNTLLSYYRQRSKRKASSLVEESEKSSETEMFS